MKESLDKEGSLHMWQQKSFQNEQGPCLYLVPTPIGNLEDMTFRAIKILKEVDVIAAEDTRQTKKLLNHFEIDTPLISYHEHNKMVSGEKIIGILHEGKKIALVSDAGMPTISDPGYELVMQALHETFPVIPLPGANAALTALIASGLKSQPFYFYGFLDRQKKEKRKQLESLKFHKDTIIFYEAPHRLKETLQLIEEIFGNRQAVLTRELTKRFEEFIRGNISELRQWAETNEIRGEFCMIIEGSTIEKEQTEENWWDHLSIIEHVEHYIDEKLMNPKEAIKLVAKERNIPKREVYQIYHTNK